jgi:coatomer protein complex subunit alpha (xenin)
MAEKMLTKFESKSNRVKGLSFHPVRPWILASLHNGQIQLWDYRMGTLLDKFEEHDGPVRGIDFHKTQPLIVSGGDDYKVKVWDYKLRRCLFTLLGHLDYIRTVQFHNEYPWIVSASDDQTIRIWNWQSRSCISVLTGHNHYVMCAAFHPKEDMIISASLDQTVRVWDTTGLRKKTVRGAPSMVDENTVVSRVNSELFGGNDALVKYVLEGHERGVNWAAFHPTLPLVLSGADDRQVKLWRMNETKAWEVDTMRGHTNNVSCVLFHPRHELIISNSEDRTIRVWDISKRTGVQTFRRETDRFWILAAHAEQNLLAAGHDSGMTVFKLERERPACDCYPEKCYYVKDRYIRLHDFNTGKDVPLVSLRRTTSTSTPGIGGGPRGLAYNSYNKAENNVLVTSDADGGSYELVTFSTDNSSNAEAQDIRRGGCMSAVFLSRDRFAVLDKSRSLLIKNFQNEVVKKAAPPMAGIDGLFFAGSTGRLLLKSEDRVLLFDYQAKKILSEVQASRIKYVVWNKDYSMLALISKHQLILVNKQLEQLCSVSETVRLKGGCWDSNKPIFVYTTLNHVKYLLPNGDRGIVRGLDAPVYATKVAGNSLYCLDREGKMRTLEIDTTEAQFKLALENKDYPEVMRMVKHSRLCGQAIITYLQEKGYPEVALHFVHDSKTRFKLALACGNIQVAMNCAHELGDDAWRQLGVEALRQGNHEVVEMSYQKTKEFDRLSFLYLLTGNTDKLRKMLKISEMRGDVMSRFHNALYLGDAEERVRVFEASGQLSLAYLTAATHGLEETADRINALLLSLSVPIPKLNPQAGLLQPPTPIMRAENWPLLAVGKSALSAVAEDRSSALGAVSAGDEDDGDAGQWGDLDLDDSDEDKPKAKKEKPAAAKGGEGEWDVDLDVSDDEDEAVPTKPGAGKVPGSPRVADDISDVHPGNPPTIQWVAESSHSADHFAAGSAETALKLLNAQIAAVECKPLRPKAISLFQGAIGFLPGLPLAPANRSYICKPATKGSSSKVQPALSMKLTVLLDELKNVYKAFTSAQFTECKETLDSIIASIVFVPAANRSENADLLGLLSICREYITALRVKALMGEIGEADPARQLELAAYFTHCNLQPSHLLLALKTAMATAFKCKVNF